MKRQVIARKIAKGRDKGWSGQAIAFSATMVQMPEISTWESICRHPADRHIRGNLLIVSAILSFASAASVRAQNVFVDNSATPPTGCTALTCTLLGGTVTVPDTHASPWTINNGTLNVGYSAQGTLTIHNGGQLSLSQSGASISIGTNAGSTGTVTVDGAGSTMTNSGLLTVGSTGNGTLKILNGGVVNGNSGIVAGTTGSVGSVVVDGAGSGWTVTSGSAGTGGLTVGQFGNASMTISNGGAVMASGTVSLGVGATGAANEVGTVTVTGAGSTLTTPAQLYVGYSSTGNLTITSGAVVSAGVVGVSLSGGTASKINIGAPAGSAPQAPGTLNTPSVVFNYQYLGLTTSPNTDAIVFNHTDTSGNYLFTPVVYGKGYVEVDAGTTALTSDSYYTGGTTIKGGALQLGNGGTSGSIMGNVTDNGTLVFDHSNTYTGCTAVFASGTNAGKCSTSSQSFSGTISGTGTVAQIGGGTTILTGANTYSGGTAISAGVLQVANNGNLGAATGPLSFDGGTLATTGTFSAARPTTLNAGGGTFDTASGTALTMNGVIGGPGALSKTDNGTLTLTATNPYTGQTTITGGTLALSGTGSISQSQRVVDNSVFDISATTADATITSLAGNGNALLGDQTLSLSAANDIFAGVISGAGGLTLNDGTEILSGTNTYAGPTAVNGGVLQAGAVNTFSPASSVTVAANGTLNLAGFSQRVANLANTGLVNMGTSTAPGTVLTVNSYVGNNGTIALNTYLGNDNSSSDRLVINGGTATGSTGLRVTNAHGPGAVTTANGILLVDTTNGGMTAPMAFTLNGRAVAGAYEYRLFRGSLDASNPDAWYLRSEQTPVPPPPPPPTPTPPGPPAPSPPSPVPPEPPKPLYRPEVAAYLSNQHLAGQMFVESLHDRLGEPQFVEGQGFDILQDKPLSGWVRMAGNWEGSSSQDGNFQISSDTFLLEAGAELAKWKLLTDADRVHAGLMFTYGYSHSDAEAAGNPAYAHGIVNGYIIGAYGTWYQNDRDKLGAYVDSWIKYGWFNNQVQGEELPTVQYNARGWAISGELGYAFPLPHDWVIEPQGQLIYVGYNEDNITEPNGTNVTGANSSGVLTRLGVRTDRTFFLADGRKLQPYATVNWWHTTANSSVSFNQLPIGSLYPANRYEVKLGLDTDIGKGWTGWANVAGAWAKQSYHDYTARIGMKYTW
jgi:outer membrane autotransporter protein